MVLRRGLSWIYNKIVAKAQQCVIAILTAGPIPRHIAFVMDGNRRYARTHGKKVQQGHAAGFDALHRVWILFTFDAIWTEWMGIIGAGSMFADEYSLRVCICVFYWEFQTTAGWSRRPDGPRWGETPGTMQQRVRVIIPYPRACTEFQFPRDLLDEYGVRLNVIGRIELFPKRVQDAARKAEKITRHNDRFVFKLHVCTNRNELVL